MITGEVRGIKKGTNKLVSCLLIGLTLDDLKEMVDQGGIGLDLQDEINNVDNFYILIRKTDEDLKASMESAVEAANDRSK